MSLRSVLGIGGLVVALSMLPRPSSAAPITIDFESLQDFEALTTQFADLTFSGATALTKGVSLNEFDYPPHSGSTVVFDLAGPIAINFGQLVYSFSGYFTYASPVTISLFDGAGALLASVASQFSSNFASDPGAVPNELLAYSSLVGIGSVVIAGDQSGASFTLDDLSYDTVPEPGTLSLLLLGGGLIAVGRRFSKSRAATV